MEKDASQSSAAFYKQMDVARFNTKYETNDTLKILTQARGRAQITITLAMAIINVALLKSVLDRGAYDNEYYVVSVALISTNLVLHIVAGFLALIIEHTLGYLSKYDQNVCQDMKENCCPWRCIWKRRDPDENSSNEGAESPQSTKQGIYTQDGLSSNPFGDPDDSGEPGTYHEPSGSSTVKRDADLTDEDTRSDRAILGSRSRPTWEEGAFREKVAILNEDDDHGIFSCCPFTCTTEVYSKYEADIVERYYRWRNGFLTNEMALVRNQEELDYQKNVVIEARSSISDLTDRLKVPDADEAAINHQIAELQKSLQTAKGRKLDYEEKFRQNRIAEDQGKLLKEYAECIRKNRVIRLASFWQHLLNYLFYVIFVFSAFIIGFAIASYPVNYQQATSAPSTASQ